MLESIGQLGNNENLGKDAKNFRASDLLSEKNQITIMTEMYVVKIR